MLRFADPDVLKTIPYPITVVTTASGGLFFGQAAVWVTQISYKPVRFEVALGHTRNTPQYVKQSKRLVIHWVTDPEIVKVFGRQSGRDVDKFAQIARRFDVIDGLPVLKDAKVVVMGSVIDCKDAGSHDVFTVEAVHILERADPGKQYLTYRYGTL